MSSKFLDWRKFVDEECQIQVKSVEDKLEWILGLV